MMGVKFNSLSILSLAIWFPFFKPILNNTTLSQLLATLVITLFVFALILVSKKNIIVPNSSWFFFIVFFYILILSVYFGSPVFRLFSDSFRYLIFGFFVAVGYSWRVSAGVLENFLRRICVYQVIFSIMVFIPSTYFIIDHFKGRLSSDELIFHFYRFSGSLGYPTEFGCFLLIPLIHLTEQRALFNSWKNIFLVFVCCGGIFASVSRAAFLVAAAYIL